MSNEDLILSKLEWARESLSQRQLSDVENLLATGTARQLVAAGIPKEFSVECRRTLFLKRFYDM